MPEDTLPASSEMVPVGAIEVRRPLRMPWLRDRGAHLLGQALHVGRGQEALGIVEREGALLARQLGAGAIGGAPRCRPSSCSASATASGVP